ncbi:hypothetical protein FRX31_017594, partial [Thalictrum thalictroides]
MYAASIINHNRELSDLRLGPTEEYPSGRSSNPPQLFSTNVLGPKENYRPCPNSSPTGWLNSMCRK